MAIYSTGAGITLYLIVRYCQRATIYVQTWNKPIPLNIVAINDPSAIINPATTHQIVSYLQ